MAATLHLWGRKDIATLLNCDDRILPDIISTEVKTEIGFKDRLDRTDKRKTFTLKHVHRILVDVYPFKTEEERLKMLLPSDYKGVK